MSSDELCVLVRTAHILVDMLFCNAAILAFLILKATHTTSWSWWWIAIPICLGMLNASVLRKCGRILAGGTHV